MKNIIGIIIISVILKNVRKGLIYMNESDSKKLIEQLNNILSNISESVEKEEILKKANDIAEELINITKYTYDEMCNTYSDLRESEPNERDKKMWEILSEFVKKELEKNISDTKLLDVGTGSGRDIRYATKLGYKTIGVDNSDGFIERLKKLEDNGLIPKNSYKKCDMRKLSFDDETFDVVRHNASLLHLPLIGKKYMADLAISEAFRVLKSDGLIYIYVKEGDKLDFVNTNEGLGGRIFQFYNYYMLSSLLQRNGFKIIFNKELTEERAGNIIKWIAVIAKKQKNS